MNDKLKSHNLQSFSSLCPDGEPIFELGINSTTELHPLPPKNTNLQIWSKCYFYICPSDNKVVNKK